MSNHVGRDALPIGNALGVHPDTFDIQNILITHILSALIVNVWSIVGVRRPRPTRIKIKSTNQIAHKSQFSANTNSVGGIVISNNLSQRFSLCSKYSYPLSS